MIPGSACLVRGDAGYKQHRRLGEEPCAACREAARIQHLDARRRRADAAEAAS